MNLPISVTQSDFCIDQPHVSCAVKGRCQTMDQLGLRNWFASMGD